MERFELAKSEEDKKKDYQEKIDYLMKYGLREEWKLRDLFREPDEEFGLNNPIIELNEFQERKVNDLFDKRGELIERYRALSQVLKGLLEEEDELWTSLSEVNHSICQIQGHRLSEKVTQEFAPGSEGGYAYWTRKCVVCGKVINPNTIKYMDCVVTAEEGPKRILTNYKK